MLYPSFLSIFFSICTICCIHFSNLMSTLMWSGGVRVGDNLVKGTLVHVCLLAHLSMKIFYDIKENLLKWLFF